MLSSEQETTPIETPRYFEEQVLRKRPYLDREWCERAARDPDFTERQPDGRLRCWKYIPELGKVLRVILETDGAIHNAFPDRRCRGGPR